MKIKEGFKLRNVANTNIVVPVAQNSLDFKGLLSLNETGAFLWRQLEQEISKEELLLKMLEEYEVAEEVARIDLEEFLQKVDSLGAMIGD